MYDYDAITANDAIGSVTLDLNPLLQTAAVAPHTGSYAGLQMQADGTQAASSYLTTAPPMPNYFELLNKRQISGWFPLFDTLRGIRGQIRVQVRLHFFGDANPFKDASAEVHFFASSVIPPSITVSHGIYYPIVTIANVECP